MGCSDGVAFHFGLLAFPPTAYKRLRNLIKASHVTISTLRSEPRKGPEPSEYLGIPRISAEQRWPASLARLSSGSRRVPSTRGFKRFGIRAWGLSLSLVSLIWSGIVSHSLPQDFGTHAVTRGVFAWILSDVRAFLWGSGTRSTCVEQQRPTRVQIVRFVVVLVLGTEKSPPTSFLESCVSWWFRSHFRNVFAFPGGFPI